MSAGGPREPVSWLLLERYALGELGSEERREIEARLRESPQDRACLELIRNDGAQLPALPAVLRLPGRRSARWPGLAGRLAVAAAIALAWIQLSEPSLPPPARSVGDGVKGGELAVVLVSDRGDRDPRSFEDGERFKLLLTCPPWFSEDLKIVVFQAGTRYEPLGPRGDLACGNLVAWPGAFALDGQSAADVCVAWGDAASEARSPHALGENAVCRRLEPRSSAGAGDGK